MNVLELFDDLLDELLEAMSDNPHKLAHAIIKEHYRQSITIRTYATEL